MEELSVYFQISKSEKFSILKQIGLETTGALTFTDSKVFVPKTSFEDITVEELEKKVITRDTEPIHIWKGKRSWSSNKTSFDDTWRKAWFWRGGHLLYPYIKIQ